MILKRRSITSVLLSLLLAQTVSCASGLKNLNFRDIKSNPILGYVADSVGNQNGVIDSWEAVRLKKGFVEGNGKVYVHTHNPGYFYAAGGDPNPIYPTLQDAVGGYRNSGIEIAGPTSITEIDQFGNITRAFDIYGDGVERVSIPNELDPSREMASRRP